MNRKIVELLFSKNERRQGCLYCEYLYHSLLSALEVKDDYTQEHSIRVEQYAELLGRKLMLSDEEILHIKIAAILHDLGKIGIEITILNKAGKLDEYEFNIIKEHPAKSVKIISHIPIEPVKNIIRHHHERFNGNGYPDNLAGNDIPVGAIILAIVDAHDAITSKRPYRPAASIDESKAEINKFSGEQFSPYAVKFFKKIPRDELLKIQTMKIN